MQVELEYGDGHVTVEVPDDSVVVSPDRTDHEPRAARRPRRRHARRARRAAGLRADR